LLDTTRLTLASILKQAGYTTGGVGKWHLGLQATEPTDYTKPMRPGPVALGFDYYFGIPASLDMEPYLYFENDRVVEQPTDSIADSRPCCVGPFFRGGPIAPGFKHIDVLPDFTDKAVGYIEQQAASESPFFLYLALAAPHTPWFPTDEFKGISGAGEYGDFTVMVDATVGRILETLDQLSLAENTLIVFTSDNGPYWTVVEKDQYGHLSQGTWRGMKADIWEGGHRVPLVARWPGQIPAGSVSDQVFSHTDFLATFAAVAGVEIPDNAGEDSFDMTPALRGEATDQIRDATIHHSANGMFAIRQGDWKLIAGRGSGGFTEPVSLTPGPGEAEGQLYNLAEDPGEMTNLYQQHPEVVERLSVLLAEMQQDQDAAPGANGFMK
jgi:arylsulfatase A-like enzyme